jgi:hypothetical protein
MKLLADQRFALAKRTCTICHTTLVRHLKEQRGAFTKRQTCGGDCANQLISVMRTGAFESDRTCPSCTKLLVPRPGELPANFKNRKTCGRSCGSRVPQLLFNFHEALLSRRTIGEILGVTSTTVAARFPTNTATRRNCKETGASVTASRTAGNGRAPPPLGGKIDR